MRAEYCALVAALLSRDPLDRPAAADVLGMPLFSSAKRAEGAGAAASRWRSTPTTAAALRWQFIRVHLARVVRQERAAVRVSRTLLVPLGT